jgi:hypothetical protein
MLTLEAHAEVNRELETQLLVSLDGVQPTEDGSLVIGGATSDKLTLLVLDQLEGLGSPTILLESGLNIVMTIDEDGLLGRVTSVSAQDNGGKLKSVPVHLVSAGVADLEPIRLEG